MSTKKTIHTIETFRKTIENDNTFELNKNKATEYILHYTKAERKI